jgi:trigger factor
LTTETTTPETTLPKSECEREVAVEVPAEVVAKESQAILEKYQKLARIPGFRRGKVPAGVLRQRFAAEIRQEVVEQLVPRFFRQEVEKQGLLPVSSPQISEMKLEEGEPLRFKATFEVLPPLEVTGYRELVPESTDTSVSPQEVDAELERLRQRQATYTAIEGSALGDGDFAEVSFTGKTRQEDSKPISLDDVMVEIGGANTVREFSENLRGARSGEERAFDVTYAQDFADPRLAGKTVEYRVTVKAIKQKNLPALDDEFAKSLGDFTSLEDLRARILENMQHEKTHRAEHEAKEKLVEALVERNQFPVPQALVDRQVDLRLERGLRALAAQGVRTQDMQKMDLPRLRAGQREAALKEVKASLILEKIAEAEKIEVSDEDIQKEIDALAGEMRQPAETIRARLTRDGALDRIRSRIRNEKALDFLYRRSA